MEKNKIPTYKIPTNPELAKAKKVIEMKRADGTVFATKVIYIQEGDQNAQERTQE